MDAAPRPAHLCPTRRDAATREGRRRPRVRAASCHMAIPESSRRGPTLLKSTPTRPKSVPTRPKSGRLGPYQPVSADIGRNGRSGRNSKKKKKKGAKRTVWLNLNTQTPSDPHISSKTPKHPLSLCPSSPFSVCSVPHLSFLCSELSVSAVCTLHCFRH